MRFANAAAFADDTLAHHKLADVELRPKVRIGNSAVRSERSLGESQLGLAVLPNNPRQPCSLRNLDTDNLAQPRLGVAYTVNPKTVVRSGFGLSYVERYNLGNQMYKNPPFFITQIYAYDAAGLPGLTFGQGIPLPLSPTGQHLPSTNMQVYDFDTKMENASVEHALVTLITTLGRHGSQRARIRE
jgi:hypothetical protein